MSEQRPHQISIQNNPSQASLFSSLLKTTFNPLTHGQMILNNTTLTLEAPGGPVRQEQSLKTPPWRTGPAASSTSWAVARGREGGRGERRFCPFPSRGFSARCTFLSTASRAPSPGPVGNPRHGEARSERRHLRADGVAAVCESSAPLHTSQGLWAAEAQGQQAARTGTPRPGRAPPGRAP